jgi:archaetidylinositol phosphate synthase
VTPWDVRLARVLVRPLRRTSLRPNAITTAGLVTSLSAAGCMASRGEGATAWGGALFMLAVLLDHMDGEFARLTGRATRFGHYYDHVAAGIGCVALFVGLGVGLGRGWLGAWAWATGGIAAAAVAAVFVIRVRVEEVGGRAMVAQANLGGFEPEDALYLVGPLAWLDLLEPFLVAAGLGAPLFLSWVGWCAVTRRSATAPLGATADPARMQAAGEPVDAGMGRS